MNELLAVIVIGSLGLNLGLSADTMVRPVESRPGSKTQDGSVDCVTFESPTRLSVGTPFRVLLLRGLEFRLSKGWSISVGPVDEPTMDYSWVVSPPLRTAPHLQIGAGYGLSARESARIKRPLRFVLTRADYDAALAAIEDPSSADGTLQVLEQLGRGRLSLVITNFRIVERVTASDRKEEMFEWVAFKGEACVPKEHP